MKKLFMLSSLVLILALFTLPALSAEEQSSELTDMILQVKNQININVDDWKFESEYINNPQDSYWQLSWHDEDFNQYLSVSVQPVTKSITSAYYNASPEYGNIYSGYPAYNEEACLETATQWVSETWPEAYAQATLQTGESQDPVIPSQRSYPYQYSFYFYRSQDGYPVSGNEINVVVNGETGKICEWSYNWKDNIVLPSTANMISLEQATAAFQKQSLFDLNYKLTNRYDPKAGQDLILTYVPKNSETFINALTGEVMDPNELFYAGHLAKGGYANSTKESVSNDERAIVLSPEEINEVDKLKQAISQEKAIQIANDFQTIPEGFQLTRASLTGNSDLVGVKATWYLYYENNNDYISYDINSTTGEVLNFYQYIGNANADNTKQITQQQAQQLAEDLIKQYNPERLEQLKLTDNHVNEGDQYSPKTYTFTYERRVNDISYPDNHYNIIISASTGKLDSYSAQWEDLQFPQPANLIAVSQIEEQYLQDNPLQVLYVQDLEGRYYLVYYTSMAVGDMYNATTGELLDYFANPVKKPLETTLEFSDIAEHPAENDILTLAKAGIISSKNQTYRPDDPITVAEWLAMLLNARPNIHIKPVVNTGEAWYANYWQEALNQGILNDNLKPNPDSQLTRLIASQTLINDLGYQKIAEINGIYILPAQDAENIKAELYGYAAIADGLGLIPAENGFFLPYDCVTRGEAAQIIMRSLKL